jgi:CHAT domain-containing protein
VLTDQYTISYAPSGTVYSRLASQQRRERPEKLSLLAVADPSCATADRAHQSTPRRDETYQPLPGTRVEVESLEQVFKHTDPEARVKLVRGSEATVEAVNGLLAGDTPAPYRFLHLATHGRADDARALQSALVLAQDRLPDPFEEALANRPVHHGRLTAAVVAQRWNLDADLAVLSACQSARGRAAGGEGFLGFQQALFLAGARSVVLSLWKVDDTATTLLMVRFYQNLLGAHPPRNGARPAGMSKADALREAKQWLRTLSREDAEKAVAGLPGEGQQLPLPAWSEGTEDRPFAHPFYWSAFVLVGDPK